LPEDVTVQQLPSQLVVLASVIVGALASYLTTAATERARWRRNLDNRWDDRRIEAYASYAQAVKDIISISSRLAAGRGFGNASEPLAPTEENLALLAKAGATRANLWESVLLLGNPETVMAARKWHETAWRLEWFARGRLPNKNANWQEARSAANEARSLFYESARKDLQVKGGMLPDPGDFEERLRRVSGASGS
jgi:hypothetical protein